jgi:hypothetical protein
MGAKETVSMRLVACPCVELVGQESPADDYDERYAVEWYAGGTQIQIRPNISHPYYNFRGAFQSP